MFEYLPKMSWYNRMKVRVFGKSYIMLEAIPNNGYVKYTMKYLGGFILVLNKEKIDRIESGARVSFEGIDEHRKISYKTDINMIKDMRNSWISKDET